MKDVTITVQASIPLPGLTRILLLLLERIFLFEFHVPRDLQTLEELRRVDSGQGVADNSLLIFDNETELAAQRQEPADRPEKHSMKIARAIHGKQESSFTYCKTPSGLAEFERAQFRELNFHAKSTQETFVAYLSAIRFG